MISAGVVGLVALIAIVCAIVAAKTWHWVNIVFLVLTLLVGIWATTSMTQVFKLRRDAMIQLKRETERAERAERELELQLRGELTSPNYEEGTLRFVNEELSRAFAGRGRVWSGGNVAAEGQARKFTFASARDVNAEGALKDAVLFAFLEQTVGDQQYPTKYIGSVRVTNESGADVTLEPIALADNQEFGQPTGTWTLFEKMPLDRRGIFKEAIRAFVRANPEARQDYRDLVANMDDPNADFDISTFRKILQNDFLPAQGLGYDPNSREYEELIDRYAFDGLSLGKIQAWVDANATGRKNPRFEPAPEEVFVKFRFDKAASKPIAVDATGSLENDGLFNLGGQAVVQEIKNNKPVEFDEGDEVLVDQRSADGYQRGDTIVPPFTQNETVTEIDRLFIRQVRDFPYEFKDLRLQSDRLVQETERLKKTNAVEQLALADARKQIETRTQLITDNQEDQESLKSDLQTIDELAQAKTEAVEGTLQQLAELRSRVDVAYEKLREYTLQISRRAFAGN